MIRITRNTFMCLVNALETAYEKRPCQKPTQPFSKDRCGPCADGSSDEKFGDAFNAADCNQQGAADYMEAEGRQLLRTAYRDAPELIERLPDLHAALDDTKIFFAYRSNDDEAVRQAHERLAAERADLAP